MSTPLVTVGVVSYNRLHYLRTLMESARECVRYPRVQWILVDGNSVEPGLRTYVESLDFVGEKIFRDCTQVEAMNEIVERAEGEYLMMLPEDVQFVRRGEWLADMVELVRDHPEVGHVQFDAQRRPTLATVSAAWMTHIMAGGRWDEFEVFAHPESVIEDRRPGPVEPHMDAGRTL